MPAVPPTWLTTLAWIWLGLAFVSAIVMIVDVAAGRRQSMRVMEWVWPITALYLGPVALWVYWRWGRAEHAARPHWVRVGISTSHCGAGCTLGDIAAEWLVYAAALSLFGTAIWASYALDYVFAFSLGIVFQYFAISQMGKVSLRELASRTARADLFSLTAFEVGLFVWMGLSWFVLFDDPHLRPNEPAFWFMMQIGMVLGFLTSYPANAWLIRRGIKEAM